MAITIDDTDIFGRSTSLLPEAPESDPVADDPLTVALLDASDDCHDDASGQSARDDLAARAARLSAVLAAARAIVANRERSTPQAIVALLVPNLADALADALAAADAAR